MDLKYTEKKDAGLQATFCYPTYFYFKDRIDTFSTWSLQIKLQKFELAAAGFFYTGLADTVECFACGIRLSEWKITDSALKEHYQWSKECTFLKMLGSYDLMETYKTQASQALIDISISHTALPTTTRPPSTLTLTDNQSRLSNVFADNSSP